MSTIDDDNGGDKPEKKLPDDLRRIMRQIHDSPTMQVARQIFNSPTFQALRQIKNSPAAQALRQISDSPLGETLRRISEIAPRMQAASDHAARLSELLHSDISIHDLDRELEENPVNNIITLIELLNLERGREASKAEQAVADMKRRTDPMDVIIMDAVSKTPEPKSVHATWAVLVKIAQSPNRPYPICGYDPKKGIEWESATTKFPTRHMNKKALGQRLIRLAKQSENLPDKERQDSFSHDKVL